jgi:hypothetical protein
MTSFNRSIGPKCGSLDVPPESRAVDGIPCVEGHAHSFVQGGRERAWATRAIHLSAVPRRWIAQSGKRERIPIDVLHASAEAEKNSAAGAHRNVTRPDSSIWCQRRRVSATLRLVDFTAFAETTGMRSPDSLDPSAVYAGWRLP